MTREDVRTAVHVLGFPSRLLQMLMEHGVLLLLMAAAAFLMSVPRLLARLNSPAVFVVSAVVWMLTLTLISSQE